MKKTNRMNNIECLTQLLNRQESKRTFTVDRKHQTRMIKQKAKKFWLITRAFHPRTKPIQERLMMKTSQIWRKLMRKNLLFLRCIMKLCPENRIG